MKLIPNILHSPKRTDRIPVLEDELEMQGIDHYNTWHPIHAPTIKESINISHKQIIQWAKDNYLPEVLIFEDDIKFLGEGAIDYYMEQKPKDYDLYLGGIYHGKIKEDNTVEKFTALHCYFVHQNFYNTFLSTNSHQHLDHALAGLGKYIVCNPMIAVQQNGYSDNEKSYQNYDQLIKNRNLYSSNKTAHDGN
jgi:hypothetical protein